MALLGCGCVFCYSLSFSFDLGDQNGVTILRLEAARTERRLKDLDGSGNIRDLDQECQQAVQTIGCISELTETQLPEGVEGT